jgi:hypothetical protein
MNSPSQDLGALFRIMCIQMASSILILARAVSAGDLCTAYGQLSPTTSLVLRAAKLAQDSPQALDLSDIETLAEAARTDPSPSSEAKKGLDYFSRWILPDMRRAAEAQRDASTEPEYRALWDAALNAIPAGDPLAVTLIDKTLQDLRGTRHDFSFQRNPEIKEELARALATKVMVENHEAAEERARIASRARVERSVRIRDGLLSGASVDIAPLGADDWKALAHTLSAEQTFQLIEAWQHAQGTARDILETALDRVARSLGIYGPHRPQKLREMLRVYLSSEDLWATTEQRRYLAAQRKKSPLDEMTGLLPFLGVNIPGYESSPFVPLPARHPIPPVYLVQPYILGSYIPGFARLFGDRMRLENKNEPASRGMSLNGKLTYYDVWERDTQPLPIIRYDDAGRPQLVLATYANPLKTKTYAFDEASAPGPRPAGLDPSARPYNVYGQTVWAIPEHFGFKTAGGNFVQTKHHAILSNLIEIQNGVDFAQKIRPEVARLTHLPPGNVHRIVSAPGETTGHADMVVGTLSFDQDVVAVPKIPDYVLADIQKNDPKRYAIAQQVNAYLDGVANQLHGQLKVERLPMLAPEIKPDTAGKSQSPFGVDLTYFSTVNFVHGPDSSIVVPIYSKELAKLSPDTQRKFHENIRDVVQRYGLRYVPFDATNLAALDGGFHCVTWDLPQPGQ